MPPQPSVCVLLLFTAGLAAAQRFEDVTPDSGIEFLHDASKTPRKYLPETMGGGVAVLDANLDGRMDVFFVNGARLGFPHPRDVEPDKSERRFWNRLYLNRGFLRFEDVTEEFGLQGRGYGMGAAVGDIDNDGDPDLLVTNAGTGDVPAAVLYRNDGGVGFSDITHGAGIEARGWATSAAFFDADNDGDLDLLILRYMRWDFDTDHRCGMEASYGRSYCHPDLFPPEHNLFYRNDGDGKFTNASDATGISSHRGKGLGLAIADFDLDGAMDVSVANDSHPQFLFRNRGQGRFTEEALIAGTAFDDHGAEFAGMGILFQDLDGDAKADLLVTTLSQERYALYFNLGNGLFDYSTGRSGLGTVTQLFAGWGVAGLDADNDGRQEVFFANGHVMDNIAHSQPHVSYFQRPLLLSLDRRRTVDVSADAGGPFEHVWASRGAATGDLDDDGLADLVVSNLNGPPYLARNVTESGNHWVGVKLRGCQSNRDGIGARLALSRPAGPTQYRSVTRSGSYLSARDPRVHFGLGQDDSGLRLTVTWPSGTVDEVSDLTVGTFNRVVEGVGCGDALEEHEPAPGLRSRLRR